MTTKHPLVSEVVAGIGHDRETQLQPDELLFSMMGVLDYYLTDELVSAREKRNAKWAAEKFLVQIRANIEMRNRWREEDKTGKRTMKDTDFPVT